jgi:type IV secretion system protein VirB9
MKKLIVLISAVVGSVALLAGLVSPVFALQTPKNGAHDDRVKLVVYDPANVVKIVGVIRISTQVQFAEGEEIAQVAIGDAVAWDVAPAGNILFLKPREKFPQTNLQIVTTRPDGRKRSYQFELTVRDGAASVASDTYFLVKFDYPNDEDERRKVELEQKKGNSDAEKADLVLNYHEAHGPRNFAYSAQGASALEPATVYDDGKATVFRFEGNSEIPSIYVVNSDGSEGLINKAIEEDLVIVQAIAQKFILRRGSDVLCIFNEAFNKAGVNPGTGTISPSVVRTLKTKGSK